VLHARIGIVVVYYIINNNNNSNSNSNDNDNDNKRLIIAIILYVIRRSRRERRTGLENRLLFIEYHIIIIIFCFGARECGCTDMCVCVCCDLPAYLLSLKRPRTKIFVCGISRAACLAREHCSIRLLLSALPYYIIIFFFRANAINPPCGGLRRRLVKVHYSRHALLADACVVVVRLSIINEPFTIKHNCTMQYVSIILL